MTHEAVVSCPCGKLVIVGKVVLVSAPEMVVGEISTLDTSGETVGVGTLKLACAPGWVIKETVVSGLPGETARV